VSIAVPNADHTGGSPQINVTVCVAPAGGHQYWIVDQSDDSGKWYAKRMISGSGRYPVRLGDGAEAGSGRTFYVVDAHGDDIPGLIDLAADDDGGGRDLPNSITKASNGRHTVR
jgi:hypothetical protein